MSDVLYLVQNNTAPQVLVSLTDQVTGAPIDMSTATSVILQFRATGATVLTDTLTGTLLPGAVNPDGTINIANYPTAGSGGRASFSWNTHSLANIGPYEGQVVITFAAGTVQTVYQTLRFFVRATF